MTDTPTQLTPEHQAWRAGDDLPEGEIAATASPVAAAASGMYGGLYRAVGKRLGRLTDDIDPALAQRGHDWEAPIADMVTIATGLHVIGEQALMQHPEYPWRRATIDGLLAPVTPATLEQCVAGLEIKTRSASASRNQPFDYWTAQCQWSLHVSGLERWVLAVGTIDDVTSQLVGLRIHELTADPGYQQVLVEIAERYRWHIAHNEMPVDDTADLDDVKTVMTDVDYFGDDTVEVDDTLLDDYQTAKADETDARDRRMKAETMLRQIVPHRGVAADGRTVTISAPAMIVTREAQEQLMADWPDLAEPAFVGSKRARQLHPDAYDAARTPTGTRRITIHQPEGTTNE